MSFVGSPSPPPGIPPRTDTFTTWEQKSPEQSKMMKIQSLLNPTMSGRRRYSNTTNNTSIHSTSIYSPANSSAQRSPVAATPTTVSSISRRKKDIDKPPFAVSNSRNVVNYPPHELHEQSICLSKADVDELYRQHKLFKIKPSASEGVGLIGDNTRYIPYSSDKKSFFGKTGRDGFNVFHYTFQLPGENDGKIHTVMWDYENGLVRITPFFKACKYSKTTPAKALTSTPGLKDLAHSITGGALAAQGYWLPYECARAVCLTFAYKIRWALVHIFGPSFVRECLSPNHKDFGKFAISREIVRCAELVAQGWTMPPKDAAEQGEIPRSVPREESSGKKELRPRVARPVFRGGSPFDSDKESSAELHGYRIATPGLETLSPKSSPHNSGWTSINPPNTPASHLIASPIHPLSHSLLTQPRFASWRNDVSASAMLRAMEVPSSVHDKHRNHKRRRSSSAFTAHDDGNIRDEDDLLSYADVSDSESDDVDIPLPSKKGPKRPRYHSVGTAEETKMDGQATQSPPPPVVSQEKKRTQRKKESKRSKLWSAEDYRAAKLLMSLNVKDDQLAMGPDGVVKTPGKV